MSFQTARDIQDATGLTDPQEINRAWWTRNPMRYDWEGTSPHPPGSREWFEEIDARFLAPPATWFAHAPDGTPFGRWMRPEYVDGKDVLEVGCGMGTHAAMLAGRGARLTAIDLTDRAVEMTTRRFEVFGLEGRIQQADAERLPFESNSFDFVWSWGVIHHSSSFEDCLLEISRVLRPGGRLLLMVYHRPSLLYWLHCGLVRGVLMGELRHKTLDEIYEEHIDGAYARQFGRGELAGVLSLLYEDVGVEVVGQKNELLPIPRSRVKQRLEWAIPDALARPILSRLGYMVVAKGVRRPDR